MDYLLDTAAEQIDWYRCRRKIEIFFDVRKNGGRVEASQLGPVSKIERRWWWLNASGPLRMQSVRSSGFRVVSRCKEERGLHHEK